MTADWSFVLIPDTQRMANPDWNLQGYFNGMRDWIIDNRGLHNIKFVAGLGDIIDRYGDEPSWKVAETALNPLLELPIPVLILASGNHDSDTANQRVRSLTGYNAHFGLDRYQHKPWFGGAYEPGKAQNMYARFEVGEVQYLAFMLEFHPRADVYQWVEQVTANHPGHRVVVVTHAFMNPSGLRDTWDTEPWGPKRYFTEGEDDAVPAENAWHDTLKALPGLFGVFSGHHLEGRVSYRIDPGHNGSPVLQGFYNWQEQPQGGRGRLMLMSVHEASGSIRQRVVRPDLDGFEATTSNGFAYDTVHPVPLGAAPLPPGVLHAIAGPGGQPMVVDRGAGPRAVNYRGAP